VNRVELANVIRFHLNELGAKNGAHDFEELCRQLAIMRIASNIVRATGPVSAGGDQGRDFETFRTYLAGTDIGVSTFVGRAAGKNLAFACTLQQSGLTAKIKSDLTTILAGGSPVETIYYFTERNVTVNNRHRLQVHSESKLKVKLEILDGLAIAEQLATAETFWIAEQFLGLPAEVYLTEVDEEAGTRYGDLRDEWRKRTGLAGTFGEYNDIRRGVRRATEYEQAKADLPFWIGKLTALLAVAAQPIRRKAFYELAVASLRGVGTMKGLEDELVAYVNEALSEENAGALEDAQVLLMYVSGARQRGLVDIPDEQVVSLRDSLDKHIAEVAAIASNSSLKAALFHSLSAVRLIPSPPYGGPPPIKQRRLVFEAMKLALDSAADGALFAIDRFADWVDLATPLIVDVDGYTEFADELDKLVIGRMGRAAAAEHRRDRAMSLLDDDRLLPALRELHQTRIDWFAGDTMRGSLLAMAMISRIYDRLRLPLAAKFYALAVAYLASKLGEDELLDLVPRGVLMAADADYQQGAILNFMTLAESGLYWRYHLQGKHPADMEETEGVMLAWTVLAQYAKIHDKELAEQINAALRNLGVLDQIQTVLDESGHVETYETPDSFAERFGDQLGAVPFSDAGPVRTVTWRELGITWQVHFTNDYETTRAGERFCALAQVSLADLATEELALIPTRVSIHLRASDTGASAQPLPSNDGRAWEVSVPRHLKTGEFSSGIIETFAIVAEVLSEVSLLPIEGAQRRIEDAFKAGLSGKLTPNTTYDVAFTEFVPPDEFDDTSRQARAPILRAEDPQPLEHPELAWRGGPGPTYSEAAAAQYLHTRYERLRDTTRFTLPRLIASQDGQAMIKALRDEGWLDWRIWSAIASVAISWRVDRSRPSLEERRRLTAKYAEIEPEDGPEVPLSEFSLETMRMVDEVAMVSTLRTWDLEIRQRTPDLPAIRRFLDDRYRQDKDDCDHQDPFNVTSSTADS
jgi:hypothetical protein